MISTADILALQDQARATGDAALKATCYAALGHDSKAWFMPLTDLEIDQARRSLASTLEMQRLMGPVAP